MERTVKRGKTAFGGWNGELANGGNSGDFWDSGLVTTKPDAADSEPGVAMELFDGGAVRAALGAADAARVSRHRLERDHGRGLSRRVGTRERLSASTARTAPWSWKRCPRAKVRRLDNEFAFTRERRASSYQTAKRSRAGAVPQTVRAPATRNGR